MAGIFSRSVAIEALYIGDEPVLAVYLGEVLVWDGTRSAFVSAVKATAIAATVAPAVQSQPGAVNAPAAAASVAAPVPGVSGSASVGASAASAAVTMNPTLSSSANVDAPAATGGADTIAPLSDAAVSAPAAAAAAAAPVPDVATTGSSVIGAPTAESSPQAPVPGVSASAPVTAPAATASGVAPIPGVSDNETVSAVAASASASAPIPAVAAIHEIPMGMDKSSAAQTIPENAWTRILGWVAASGYTQTVITGDGLALPAGSYDIDLRFGSTYTGLTFTRGVRIVNSVGTVIASATNAGHPVTLTGTYAIPAGPIYVEGLLNTATLSRRDIQTGSGVHFYADPA